MTSFVTKETNGLAHMFLIPSTVRTTINNRPVTIISNTNYPFSSNLFYEITSSTPFDFYVRIPGWATNDSTYSIDFQNPKTISLDADSLLHIPVGLGVTIIKVDLASEIRLVPRANNTVSIYKGYVTRLDFSTSPCFTYEFSWEVFPILKEHCMLTIRLQSPPLRSLDKLHHGLLNPTFLPRSVSTSCQHNRSASLGPYHHTDEYLEGSYRY